VLNFEFPNGARELKNLIQEQILSKNTFLNIGTSLTPFQISQLKFSVENCDEALEIFKDQSEVYYAIPRCP
jgi:hypothetical protein